MENRIIEHLNGFEERRKKAEKFQVLTEKYHKDNTKRLDSIERHQRDREAVANANHEEVHDTLKEQNRVLEEIKDDVKETKIQAKMTNGRVTKLERYMLIVGTAVAVTIILKFPQLTAFLHLIP